MGKLILCAGKTAVHPYVFKATGTAVYTIEELCYYIYHNVESVSDELFTEELVTFIREELGLNQRADFIHELIIKKAGFKDLIVSIFCSADYYDKGEINRLLLEIDMLYRMTPIQRKKRQADYCMRHGQYKEALKEYHNVLNSKEFTELTSEEYGDILHNMGVLLVQTGAFVVAAAKFREAYERNGRIESLKQYLYALKLSNQEELFERELKLQVGSREVLNQIEEELYHTQDTLEYSTLFAETARLQEYLKQGQMDEYEKRLNEVINQLKVRYRKDSL